MKKQFKDKNKTKPIGVIIPNEFDAIIRIEAAKKGITKSEYIRQATQFALTVGLPDDLPIIPGMIA